MRGKEPKGIIRRLCLRVATGWVLAAFTGAWPAHGGPAPRPHLLWITAEDISPNLGCYGDPYAVTPHLDTFAAEALRYTNTFSIHPCCSPSRSALATGVYPTRLGTFQHRGKISVNPELVRCFTTLLREAGYYCFNGTKGAFAKTDYNFTPADQAWDVVGTKEINWRSRAAGQPFFGQINLFYTHQSQYGLPPGSKGVIPQDDWARVHDPSKVHVPPYLPDTPAVRDIWRQYHDRITQMDGAFGRLLEQLKADGLADDTIVFFFGDNGHGVPGGKIWLWDQGVHVPLLIHFPKKWAHLAGPDTRGVTDRLGSFVDFAPTTLALAGVKPPSYMQGEIFLGPTANAPRAAVFAARDFHDGADFDTSRMVRDQRYHYIRNFMPQQGWDAIQYSWERAPAMLESWRQAAATGKLGTDTRQAAFFRKSKPVEDLYDTQADPWQLRNLAADPAQRATLERLRAQCEAWMIESHDLGLLSQFELYTRSAADTPYAMATDPQRNPIERLVRAAALANRANAASLPQLLELLQADDSAVRRWGALGLLTLGTAATPAREALVTALRDPAPDVRMTAAEALCTLGLAEPALATLRDMVVHPSRIVRNETLLALCRVGPAARALLPSLALAAAPSPLHNGIWSYDNVAPAAGLARAFLDESSSESVRRTRLRYLP